MGRFIDFISTALAAVLALMFLTLLGVGIARAQSGEKIIPRCDTFANMKATLFKMFGEEIAATGINNLGRALSLFIGPDGTYTVTLQDPGQDPCIVDSGTDWTEIHPTKKSY